MPIDLSKLDEEQRAAVIAGGGPVLVFAGAGSGKTRTLTARIAYLIESGVDPGAIMAVTFTRKAAEEMRVRCRRLVGHAGGRDGMGSLRIGTFHSQMATLLRSLPPEYLARLGRTAHFSVWDSDDQSNAVGAALREADITLPKEISKSDVASRISAWKNDDLVLPGSVVPDGSRTLPPRAKGCPPAEYFASKAWPLYERMARAADAFDFDDLLAAPVYLLGTDAALTRTVSGGIGHLLVDEFQDTNSVQMHLVSLLSAANGNLFVVGDDAQSIYRFRGARIENILGFDAAYPGAKRFVLSTNYRSTQPILNLANMVIAGSQVNIRKDLRAHNSDEAARKPTLRLFDDEDAEAAFVVEEIKTLGTRGVKLADLAILVRVRAQTRAFEDAARRSGVPYRVVGGFAFWDRREVKDLMAWLRLVLNKADTMAFTRAVSRPKRGVGPVMLESILRNAGVRGGDVMGAARTYTDPQFGLGNAKSRAALLAMCDVVSSLAAVADHEAPSELVRRAINDSGLAEHWGGAGGPEADSAIENLYEVVNAANRYEPGFLRSFVEDSTIEAVSAHDPEADLMTIATLHGAKGLEWRGVYLAGFEEGLLPYARALEEEGGEDEERRLAYVGITRARTMLTMTSSSSRFLAGERVSQRTSRFLDRAGLHYTMANHRTPDGGMGARIARASARSGAPAPTNKVFSNRPTAVFAKRRPGS